MAMPPRRRAAPVGIAAASIDASRAWISPGPQTYYEQEEGSSGHCTSMAQPQRMRSPHLEQRCSASLPFGSSTRRGWKHRQRPLKRPVTAQPPPTTAGTRGRADSGAERRRRRSPGGHPPRASGRQEQHKARRWSLPRPGRQGSRLGGGGVGGGGGRGDFGMGIWILGRRRPPAAAVRRGAASSGGSGGRGRGGGGFWRRRRRGRVGASRVPLVPISIFIIRHG